MADRLITRLKHVSWLRLIPAGLWALVFIGLPLTSFPILTHLSGATVAPFSAIPLGVLALIWFLPYLLRRGSLPKETIPLLFFTLFVTALAAYSFFADVGMFRNRSMLSQLVRAFVPFGTGLAFFLMVSARFKNTLEMRRALQLTHIGGAVMVIWAILQGVILNAFQGQFPPIMQTIGAALSTQMDLEGTRRAIGFAFEPSWLAHQLNILYLPLWLAATYQRSSVFPKLWKFSVENILLMLGMVAFFMASPRIGAAAFMLMMLYMFLKFNLAMYHWIIQRLAHLWNAFKHPRLIQWGVGGLIVILFIGIYTAVSLGGLKIAGANDYRINLLLSSPFTPQEMRELSALDENALFLFSRRLLFMERTVYWMTGWHIFNDYPWLGVGLGNTGYYFTSHMPSIGWASTELRSVIYYNDSLPNTKSIWYRLLAETGIVGFAIFITWLLIMWLSTNVALHSRDATFKTVALAGQFALVALVFEGLSVDTFGLPYLFVMLGLVAAARRITCTSSLSQ